MLLDAQVVLLARRRDLTLRSPITVRLERFEGPLDLLLYLIQSHELDISTISVAKVTDQYLVTLRLMQELNFDVASEFLVIAATLIFWKSRAILPQENDGQAIAGAEEDLALSPEELLRQLLEHRRFLAAGDDLAQQPKLGEDVFTRPNSKPPIAKVWREMNITDLALSHQEMLVRERKRNQILRKETVSVGTKITEFADQLQVGVMTKLRSLLSAHADVPETVVTFLASLELSKLKKLRIYQEKAYDDIFLELLESLKGFKIGLATEFDLPTGALVKETAPAQDNFAPPAQ